MLERRCADGLKRALLFVGGSCDEGGGVGGSEAVVDVDYGDIGRAGVKHAEQSCGSVERCSVAYGGGDGEDRDSDEASDDGGERAFHSGADDHGIGVGELFAHGEEAVDAGDSYIVEAGYPGVEELGCDGGFFGDGQIAGSGADYGDMAVGRGMGGLTEGERSGLGMVDGCGDGLKDGYGGRLVGAGGEDVVSGGGHAGEDFGYLGRSFAGGVDDFGEAGAEGAVVVDAGMTEVFEGEVGEAVGGFCGSKIAALYGGEEF